MALPSHLPRSIGDIRVFHIKRIKQRVESSQPQEFCAINGHGTAVPPKHGNIPLLLVCERNVLMLPVEVTTIESCAGFAGFLPSLSRIREKHLAANSKHVGGAEATQQGGEKILFHDHVIVEQENDVVLRVGDAQVVAAPKIQILFAPDYPNFRKMAANV